MNSSQPKLIDIHVHAGLLGNRWPEWGRMTDWYRSQTTFKIFLLYAGLKPEQISDTVLHEKAVETINSCRMDNVVCLAMDPVYDNSGKRREELSHLWLDNEYIVQMLRKDSPKVLLGASVHPYDTEFKNRVKKYVDSGAVLLKWVPSAQQINLADERVGSALEFLASAKDGKPLPLLLHIGPEYAIPTTDEKTFTYDFHSWSLAESIRNWFRFSNKWHTPDVKGIENNIIRGLRAGAAIIFAHCGLPYFASGLFSFFEHSDFQTVKKYLKLNEKGLYRGCCYADVSALSTPFRLEYFSDVSKLPAGYLLFGSDFPTPIFELYSNIKEKKQDFKAVLDGHLERAFVPEDNLLDVNYHQLRHAFPAHPLFENFSKMM